MDALDASVAMSAASLFVASVNLLGNHVPPMKELAGGSVDDDALLHKLRTGEASSALLIFGAGAVAAILVQAVWPLALAAGAVALSIVASEFAIRRPCPAVVDGQAAAPVVPLRPAL